MHRRRHLFSGPMRTASRAVLSLALVVVATILFVGKKVEIDNVSQRIDQRDRQADRLRRERAQLMALIVFRQKPGAVEQIARGLLEMEYSAGRLSHLTLDAGGQDAPE